MSVQGVPGGGIPAIPSAEDKQMSMFSHLGGGIGTFISGGMLGFVAPLILMMTKGKESAFIDEQSKEALNFQLVMVIAFFVATVLSFITCGIGAILYFPISIVGLIFGVIGGMASNKGEAYKYPFNIRMVK